MTALPTTIDMNHPDYVQNHTHKYNCSKYDAINITYDSNIDDCISKIYSKGTLTITACDMEKYVFTGIKNPENFHINITHSDGEPVQYNGTLSHFIGLDIEPDPDQKDINTLNINMNYPPSNANTYNCKNITTINAIFDSEIAIGPDNNFTKVTLSGSTLEIKVCGFVSYKFTNLKNLENIDFNVTRSQGAVNPGQIQFEGTMKAFCDTYVDWTPTNGKVNGSAFDDTLAYNTGYEGDKGLTINGNAGDDNITGSQFNDTITGGAGKNTINVIADQTFGSDVVNFTKGKEELTINFTKDSQLTAYKSGNDIILKDGQNKGLITIKNGAKADLDKITVLSEGGLTNAGSAHSVTLDNVVFSEMVKGTYTTGKGNKNITTSDASDTININGEGTKTINLTPNASSKIKDTINLTNEDAVVQINSTAELSGITKTGNDLTIGLGADSVSGTLVIKNLFNAKTSDDLIDAMEDIEFNGLTELDSLINAYGLNLGTSTQGTRYYDIISGTAKADKITTGAGDDVIYASAGADTLTIDGEGIKTLKGDSVTGAGSTTIKFTDDAIEEDATIILEDVNSESFAYKKSGKNLTLRTVGEDGSPYDITINDYYNENGNPSEVASLIFDENGAFSTAGYDRFNDEVDKKEKAILGDNSEEPDAMILSGTKGNDKFISYAASDTIYGFAGVDTIYTGAGNDTIDGGAGADKIYIDGGGYKTVNIERGEGGDVIDSDYAGDDATVDIYFASAEDENTEVVYNFSGNDIVAKTFDKSTGKVLDTATVKNYFSFGGTYGTEDTEDGTYTWINPELTMTNLTLKVEGTPAYVQVEEELYPGFKNLVSGSKGSSTVTFTGKAENIENPNQTKSYKVVESVDSYFHGTKGNDSFTLGSGEHELNTFGGSDMITITGEAGHLADQKYLEEGVPTGLVTANINIAADNAQTTLAFDRTLLKQSESWSEGDESGRSTSQWQKYSVWGGDVHANINFEDKGALSFQKNGDDLVITNKETNSVVLSGQFDHDGYVCSQGTHTYTEDGKKITEKYTEYADYTKFELSNVNINGTSVDELLVSNGVTVKTEDGKTTFGTEYNDTFNYNSTKGGLFVDGAQFHDWEVSGYNMYESDDTYNVTANSKSKSVVVADGGGENDTINFTNAQSDLALFFNVKKGTEMEPKSGEATYTALWNDKESRWVVTNSLYVFQKDALTTDNIRTLFQRGNTTGAINILNWFDVTNEDPKLEEKLVDAAYATISEHITGGTGEITQDEYSLAAGVVENVSFAGEETTSAMEDWINSVRGNVSAWLTNNTNYEDAASVFTGGNDTDIAALITLYQGGTYPPPNVG